LRDTQVIINLIQLLFADTLTLSVVIFSSAEAENALNLFLNSEQM